MIYIVMGVSGCGKTLIGKLLAEKLSLPFYDGDDFHPEENINKMSAGIPLNDNDRLPWIRLLSEYMIVWENEGGAVLACSALRQAHRNILESIGASCVFIYLKGEKDLIQGRMKKRRHFMPPELLASQFKALEEPEEAVTVSIKHTPGKIVNTILQKICRVK